MLCRAVSLLRIQESQPHLGLLQVGSDHVIVHSAANRLIVGSGEETSGMGGVACTCGTDGLEGVS